MPYAEDYYDDELVEAFDDDDNGDFIGERVVHHRRNGRRRPYGRPRPSGAMARPIQRPYQEGSRVPASQPAVAHAFDRVRDETSELYSRDLALKKALDRMTWSTLGAVTAGPLLDAFVPTTFNVLEGSSGAMAASGGGSDKARVTKELNAASAIPPLIAALPLVWGASQTKGVFGDLGGPLLIGAIAFGLFKLAKE